MLLPRTGQSRVLITNSPRNTSCGLFGIQVDNGYSLTKLIYKGNIFETRQKLIPDEFDANTHVAVGLINHMTIFSYIASLRL